MKSKQPAIAPWARDSSGEADSQSDSETNNSHQSGDTDSVFSDKSNPSKMLSDDDTGMKRNSNSTPPSTKPVKDRPLGNSAKLWEANVRESQKKDEKKKWEPPQTNNNSNNSAKIKNITQAFEQKDKQANEQPVIRRRSDFKAQKSMEYGSNNRFSSPPVWKSLDLNQQSPIQRSLPKTPMSPTSPLSPTGNKALMPRDQRYSSTPLKTTDTSFKDKVTIFAHCFL